MGKHIHFHYVDCAGAAELIEREDVMILDVRSPEAFAAGHMPEAHNIGICDLKLFVEDAPRDMPVLIYCGAGLSCEKFAVALGKMGFRHVSILEGGYREWARPILAA